MNGNISICSSENELDIKYGLIDFGKEREIARSSFKYILSDIRDIKSSYFRLGFHLHEFKVNAYYNDFGYATFEEFCEANLDMDKGGISRCINVFLMTNSHGETIYRNGVQITGCYSVMSDKYSDYSYSQLCEMLSMDDKHRALVKPDMTVKEIRKIKNKITDISKVQLMKFFDYFKEEVKPFTRDNFIAVLSKQASTWGGHCGESATFQLRPGKVQINWSDYYSFDKIIKYYEACGGTLEEEKVATSQPDDVRLCVNDLLYKKGIVLQNHIKKCKPILDETIELYDSKGKLIGKYECDLLMAGVISGTNRRFYRVSEPEEEGTTNG